MWQMAQGLENGISTQPDNRAAHPSCQMQHVPRYMNRLTVPQQCCHHVRTLALIGCDDAQLIGHDAALQEACEQLLHVGSLSAVEVAGACAHIQAHTHTRLD